MGLFGESKAEKIARLFSRTRDLEREVASLSETLQSLLTYDVATRWQLRTALNSNGVGYHTRIALSTPPAATPIPAEKTKAGR
jgi:hypothetical protein